MSAWYPEDHLYTRQLNDQSDFDLRFFLMMDPSSSK
jgi:hypothetical protein